MEFTEINYNSDFYKFVYQTKKIVYMKYVEANWGKWDDEVQKELFKEFINTNKENINIIIIKNIPIGFYHVEKIQEDICEIGNICIIPEYQGKGIGTYILNKILKENEDKDIILQFLSKILCGALYKRLGFRQYGETNYHFQMIKRKVKDNCFNRTLCEGNKEKER